MIIEMVEEFHWLGCLPGVAKGCADVGVESDNPNAQQTCKINNRCLPVCEVKEYQQMGTSNEQINEMPSCLEVSQDGIILNGNIDKSLSYEGGNPDIRDNNLPVDACWKIIYNDECTISNYAQFIVSRRNDPPPLTFTEVSCIEIPKHEENCADGVDNDEDCLNDLMDEDCN